MFALSCITIRMYVLTEHKIINTMEKLLIIRFEKAIPEYRKVIFEWLENAHVKEFWDNTVEHKQDIIIFMHGRKEPSPYSNGIFDYWVGLFENEPFCLVMTSSLLPMTNLSPLWLEYSSNTGTTCTIDFMIGNEKYVGKKLGAPTLIAFMQYFHKYVKPETDTFIIDPATNNPKAQHVYEKAGFAVITTFTRKNSSFVLMVKKAPFDMR